MVFTIFFQAFKAEPSTFPKFFHHVLEASLLKEDLNIQEQTVIIVFLIHCFNSLVRPINMSAIYIVRTE